MSKQFNNLEELFDYINNTEPTIIVVEGYNGVGKSRVLEEIASSFCAEIYRPSYDRWATMIPAEYRWSIFSSFIDGLNAFMDSIDICGPLVLDRGFFSGVVYNDDPCLANKYKDIIQGMKVLNILVTCDEDSYNEFIRTRSSEKVLSYRDCQEFTEAYRYAFKIAGAEYVEFLNTYDPNIGENHSETCRGCSHYNLGDSCCMNPRSGYKMVPPTKLRCEHSSDMEVQDVRELQSMSS